MSFDLYVGNFTRYITGEWENMGQRAAREQGIAYKLIRDNETEEAPPPPEEVRQAVAEWLAHLNEGLAGHLDTALAWDESDDAPYFTDRPGWAGYAALLLHAAYDDHPDLPRPAGLPEEWGDDPAYVKATDEEGETRYPALLLADLWLPGEFEFMFGVEDLGGNPRAVASLAALREELAELNARTFNGTPAELAEWRRLPGAEDAPLDQLAKMGLAMMIAMADEAAKHGLPLMPDY